MSGHSKHPCYRAIQQSIERITQILIYDDVKCKLLTKELLTMDDVDEYDRLPNREAVLKMTSKVMHSIKDCKKFLIVLQEMPQEQYVELAKSIADKCEQNRLNSINGASLLFAIGCITCLVVIGFLFSTPATAAAVAAVAAAAVAAAAAAASIPLVIAGAVGMGASFVTWSVTKLCTFLKKGKAKNNARYVAII